MLRFVKLPKDQLILVLALGTITSYYVWLEPIKEYHREKNNLNNNTNNNISEKMARPKKEIPLLLKLCVGTMCIGTLGICYKYYLHKYVIRSKRNEAEQYANFLYDKLKEKEENNGEVKS